MKRTPQEQLTHFLSDMYSVEQQALAQLVSAPEIAGDLGLAADFREHHDETERQAELVRERLEACGGSPSAVKDAIMKIGGKGFLLFAQVQPETPGRLIDHAYAYEAMEWAGYEMLIRFAKAADDAETVATAETIRRQERAMMERLEKRFDAAEQASHVDVSPEELDQHLTKHLAEVHAFESQGVQLLEKSQKIAGNSSLEEVYHKQLLRIREHMRLVEERLEALGSDVSELRDGVLAVAGLNWGWFFQMQSDTPAKLAAFVYAVLHLQIGGYELLKRTAQRLADPQTQSLCETVLADKRQMAEMLVASFDSAIQATLEAVHA